MAIDKILERLDNVQETGGSQTARCPGHEDNRNSLSVSEGEDGRVLLHCHAGCATADVLRAVGLQARDLFPANGDGRAKITPTQKKRGKIVAEYDYRDASGKLLYQAVRFEPKDFRQRKPEGEEWSWKLGDVSRVLYRLPELIAADADATVFVVEGEKDADRLAELGAITTTSVGGASKGKSKWRREYNDSLSGRHVVILPDNDEPGQRHAETIAEHLSGVAESVRIVQLPDLDDKGDASDWLDAGGTLEQLRELADAVAEYQPTGRRTIMVSTNEQRVIDEAISALATSDEIYQRGGALVHIVTDAKPPRGIKRPADAPRIVPIGEARLRELLSKLATWEISKGDSVERTHPPVWVIKGIVARGQWDGIPPIEAVTETPVLRSDGSVVQTAGYDHATGILYAPRCDYPEVAERPSKAEAERARDELLDVVADFPFADPAHRSTWLAATLTPLARYAYHGCTPLFLVDANVRGSGKGLCVDTSVTISTGRDPARMTAPKNDEECRKRITAIAVAGEPIVLIDNIAGSLALPSLDSALTSTSWSDRVLGFTELTSNPLYVVWFATGNNIALGGDTPRRTAHIRLESQHERPELRDDFRHPDLLAWLRRERPRLVVAALTILRAWFAAGKPGQKLPRWGSYEEWSAIIRHAVVWVGLPDPAETREQLEEAANTEGQLLRQLIEGWQEIDQDSEGAKVSHVIKTLSDHPDEFDTLRSALMELPGAKADKLPSAVSIGKKLQHFRRRIISGKYLDSRRDRKNTTEWYVANAGGSGGSGGNPYDDYASDEKFSLEKKEETHREIVRRTSDTSGTSGTSGNPSIDNVLQGEGWMDLE